MPHPPAILPLALLAALAAPARAYTYNPSDFVTSILAYTPGAGVPNDSLTGQPFSDPTTALGRPTVDTTGDGFNISPTAIVPVVPVYPAFRSTQLVTIGSGGSLTLAFDHPIQHDSTNPFGSDFIIFGNTQQSIRSGGPWTNFTSNPNSVTAGSSAFAEPGTVSVSQDGLTWFTFTNGPYADSFAPTLGRVYDPAHPDPSLGAANLWWGAPTNPTLPLDPSLTAASFNNMTVAAIAQTYGQSAGGTSFNLSTLGLSWIKYIRIDNNAINGSTPDIDAVSAVAPNEWSPSAGGDWSTPSNWTRTASPNGPSVIAALRNNLAADATITLSAPITLGQLLLDSSHHITLAGSSPLTIQSPIGAAAITITSGQHTLSVPIILSDPTTITTTAPDSSLTLTNTLTASSAAITKAGPGTLTLPPTHFAALTITAGTVAFSTATPSAVSRIDALSLSPTTTLDLTTTSLIITHGDLSALTNLLAQSYNPASSTHWTTPGLLSSTAAASATPGAAPATLAILPASAYLALHGPNATFLNQPISPTDILIRYTLPGDADLDGTISLADYQLLDYGYLTGATDPLHGNFDYDSSIDATDFALIDASYAYEHSPQSAALIALHTAEFGPAYTTALAASLPEPAPLTLLALAAPALLRRRRPQ